MKAAILERYDKNGSVDEIYTLEEVNKALEKVASGGSKGKTILRIS